MYRFSKGAWFVVAQFIALCVSPDYRENVCLIKVACWVIVGRQEDLKLRDETYITWRL